MTEETNHLLRQIPLFSTLEEEELSTLGTITTRRFYQKQEVIFMEGQKREAVYFISKGIVKTSKTDQNGKEHIINFLQPGEMFPHVGFFEQNPYPATAQVLEEAELYVIRIKDFDQLMFDHPNIAVQVMKVMGQKLSLLTERIQELSSRDVRHRLISTLIRLAEESGITIDNQPAYITVPLTNTDLANMVGSTRESINRVLNELKKKNLLRSSRSSIEIINLSDLKATLR
ncbi:Crp/Fnr family transcriptional regulator [Pontibacillus sp. ALD_SL1]|uniref:Crp/Fnr family transcriptional regulator n=1 Tax=Pontibacillus sp. ALD_SL1 TaxID=2777185 RepID=UPI001A95A8FE|nr:Crp/Fnr family transcriptional regulator [Pontibacillus sp. ALD_SL1]QST01752.1 Crp/Fnr family transcriptional regulator [Pontibacillus sp. ALD_SL1]